MLLGLSFIFFLLTIVNSSMALFPSFDALTSDPFITGLKNIIGGILAADQVHDNCLQKTICSEFSNSIVEMREGNSINRDGRRILIPTILQRKGYLRWIGDAIRDFLRGLISPLLPKSNVLNRRTLGASGGGGILSFISSQLSGIPPKYIISIMDFFADATNIMNRQGVVYPFFRSATAGYGFGHRKDDNFPGVCSQIAENCGSWWDHLNKMNKYEAGHLSRRAEIRSESFTRDGKFENDWNFLKVESIFKPKVLLCKISNFLTKVNEKMGGAGVKREKFISEDFEQSCDPLILEQENYNYNNNNNNSVTQGEVSKPDETNDLSVNEIEIIEARSSKKENIDELPILVFEGAPLPQSPDVTEIEVIEKLIQSSFALPSSSVRNALRLPMKSRGKSIVLVEMDTEVHRQEILDYKDKVRSSKSLIKNIGIRKAKYKELWTYLENLVAVKSV